MGNKLPIGNIGPVIRLYAHIYKIRIYNVYVLHIYYTMLRYFYLEILGFDRVFSFVLYLYCSITHEMHACNVLWSIWRIFNTNLRAINSNGFVKFEAPFCAQENVYTDFTGEFGINQESIHVYILWSLWKYLLDIANALAERIYSSSFGIGMHIKKHRPIEEAFDWFSHSWMRLLNERIKSKSAKKGKKIFVT